MHASGMYGAALERLAVTYGLDGAQTAALSRYVDLLLGWRRGNVTGLNDPVAVVDTLIGDSLALLAVPQLREREGAGWLDLGSGAGIPGIPLAVALPTAELTVLDSVAKKCAFLEEAVAACGLATRARVVCARSERFAAAGRAGPRRLRGCPRTRSRRAPGARRAGGPASRGGRRAVGEQDAPRAPR